MKIFEKNIRMAYHIASQFTPNTIVDMEDIKQLALIGLYKASQNYKDSLGVTFSTYAYKVMRNEILKELSKHNICDSIDEMEYDVADESCNPEEEYIGSLQRFSSVLTNQEHEVVLLTVQGYSQKEISLRLNLSQSQISRIFIKAKKKIKEVLEDGCVANVG